ncbi:MAG: phosphate acyltransferase [Lachnospiraceae bacterium]
MYQDFLSLRNKFTASEKKTIVVAAAHDEHTLEAVFLAEKSIPMQSILVGDRKRIIDIAKRLGNNGLDEKLIIDADDNDDCARKAVALIRDDSAQVLMKGIMETSTLLKAVLNKQTGIRESATMSHLALLETPGYHKLVAITDGGMIPHPTLEQKADIVRNAVNFYQKLGFRQPRIAALAAAETVSEKIPESVDAAALQAMCERGELGDCLLEGPLSFDIAVSSEAAAIKGYTGKISGDVDILLVPAIATGNILSKGLLYWGGAKMAGCILGAKVPIILVSRGASAEEKLLSIMLCLCANTK